MNDAIEFVKSHAETVGEFTSTRFIQGEKQETETRHTYTGVLEYLEKFPKYVRSVNLKTGKIIIANTLYRF
jgi:hypothetical protein